MVVFLAGELPITLTAGMPASPGPLWVSQDQVEIPQIFQAQHHSSPEHLIPVLNLINLSRWKGLHHWGFRKNVSP